MNNQLLKKLLRPGYKVVERNILEPIRLRAFDRAQNEEFQIFLKNAMNYVFGCHIEGDYLEFGSFRGNTLTSAFLSAKRYRLDSMKFFVFDSFEGLPPIAGVDSAGPCHYEEGQYACSLEEFNRIIARRGVDLRRVIITKGWYDKTLNEETRKRLHIKKAAIIWIDCDLYESTVPVLDFITPYIQTGTILCFDDWFCFGGDPTRGEARAFREWLKKNSWLTAIEYRKFESAGHSFLMNVATDHTK
jgi:O-methyltransferase